MYDAGGGALAGSAVAEGPVARRCDATLWARAVPVKLHVTVSPALIVTVLRRPAVVRVGLRAVDRLDDRALGGRGRRGERGERRQHAGERDAAPHGTTSSCSIIARSACSSAWQWNTYRPL